LTHFIIYFHQQWVGDHSEAWFQSRGPRAREVVDEMRAANVLVFAGGLVEEVASGWGFDQTGTEVGRISTESEFIGGLTIIDVASEEDARLWGAKVAQACGWPQEVRRFK
jgi:hypothetical protein